MIYQLVYSSVAVTPFTGAELLELLQKARTRNTQVGITGLLLYRRGEFMQLLEGEEKTVLSLYGLICKDPKHHRIVTLLSSPATGRVFPAWSMGFQNLEGTDLGSVPGYDPAPHLPLSDESFSWDTSVAMRLLAGFAGKG